jgi:hypothetical protein
MALALCICNNLGAGASWQSSLYSFEIMAFDFLASFDSAIAATAKVAEQQSAFNPADILSDVFKDAKSLKIVLSAGVSWSEFTIDKLTPERKSQEVFKRMQPTQRGDDFDRAKIKSYFVLRCCIAALAAESKGKIATVDVMALYIGLCKPYKPASSLRAIVAKVAQDLNTTAESKGDFVTINITGSAFAGYVKPANLVIQAVKDAANSGDL